MNLSRWIPAAALALLAIPLALLATPLAGAAPATAQGSTGSAELDARPEGAAGEPGAALVSILTAALQTVHDRYAPSAKPVPAEVSERLAEEYGSELARARYVVSQLAVDVLAAIDRLQGTSLGEGAHAVTVDDLIVFASEPSISDLWIWAHELHHVRQYQERGSIREFARWYLSDCQVVEQAADERANRALGENVTLRHCLGTGVRGQGVAE